MKEKLRKQQKGEPEIAIKLIQQLDGLSIAEAKAALDRAVELLAVTQVVSAKNDFAKKRLLI